MFCFAQDASVAGGSVGAARADTIVCIQRLARESRLTVIGFVQSACRSVRLSTYRGHSRRAAA